MLIFSGSTAGYWTYDSGSFTVSEPGSFKIGSANSSVKSILVTQSGRTAACGVNSTPGTSYVTLTDLSGTYVVTPSTATSCGGGGLPAGSYSAPTSPAPTANNPTGGFSVSINNNTATTNTKDVTLTLNAGSDTARMAISNTEDFNGSSQEAYQATKSWALTEGDGTKTVYVKFFTQSGQASNIVSDTITLDSNSSQNQNQNQEQNQNQGQATQNQEQTQNQGYDFTQAVLMKVPGSSDVWVWANGTKRKVRSLEIFNSYSWNASKVLPSSQGYIDSLPETNLVKTSDSPNVYIFSNGFKRLLASIDIFNSYQLDWSKIATVNTTEMNSYQNAPLIKHNADLFWKDQNGVLHQFPSMDILTKAGYNTKDAITIDDLEFTSYGVGIAVE
jgi:hypothetical protein